MNLLPNLLCLGARAQGIKLAMTFASGSHTSGDFPGKTALLFSLQEKAATPFNAAMMTRELCLWVPVGEGLT